jgi:hypothetical protein
MEVIYDKGFNSSATFEWCQKCWAQFVCSSQPAMCHMLSEYGIIWIPEVIYSSDLHFCYFYTLTKMESK